MNDPIKENLNEYPVLPLRDIVVFPNIAIPLFVGREKSIKALDAVTTKYKKIILVAQKNAEVDDPQGKEVFSYGTLGEILQLLKLPDGTVKILVEGKSVVKIKQFKDNKDFLLAQCEELVFDSKKTETLSLSKAIVNKYEKLSKISKKFTDDNSINFKNETDPVVISNKVASNLSIDLFEKQKLLEITDVQKKLESILGYLDNEIDVLSVEKRIRGRVKNQMEKTQREYYLNEQLKAIQKELGEIEEGKDETKVLEDSIKKAKMSKEAEEKCLAELKKLRMMSPMLQNRQWLETI
jgi:ATP-dependent Lon protease